MSTYVPRGLDVFENATTGDGALPEDKVLMRLDTDFNTVITVFHDRVFDAVITRLTRPITSGDVRVIALEVEEIEMLYLYADRILRLADRYAHTGRKVKISYELGTRVRARLDLEGLGFLDIRRIIIKYDQAELHIIHGVRIPVPELSDFCEKIGIAHNFIINQKEKI
jgi:hypothetical protein